MPTFTAKVVTRQVAECPITHSYSSHYMGGAVSLLNLTATVITTLVAEYASVPNIRAVSGKLG